MVLYSTRNEVKTYASSGTIYTGVGSGLSLESQGVNRLDYFGSKLEFANILNIFKARETKKEVLIRLFVQGLILDSWDPQYISRKNYNRLQEKTPQYIKDLVRNGKDFTNIPQQNIPLVMVDTSKLKGSRIYTENQFYTVKKGDDLLSISEHFNTLVSEIMDWNQLTQVNLVTGSSIIVRKNQKVIYSKDAFGVKDTMDLFMPDTNFYVQANINREEFEASVERVIEYSEQNDTNYIYGLLNYTNPNYSYKAISGISVKRVSSSGLVEVSFKKSDPGICQQTLIFLIEAFEKNYSKLFENQSDHIIAYFEKRVAESAAKLQAAENRLLKFNQDNNIINYYEQTRHISDQKEQLDSRYYDEKMNFTSADSVLRQLEKQIESQKGVSMHNKNLLDYRNRLSEVTYKIAINELNDSKDPKTIAAIQDLQNEKKELKDQIRSEVNSVYGLQFSPEGVNSNDILSNWLNKTIQYEESKAKLAALYERKKEFQKTYETFAPLGAKLARIEREIDVFEQQYMSLLQSLNQAKLKQQSIAFKSNVKVVDPPYYPLNPEGSKRKLFIVVAGVVGFILVLFIILVLEYFDSTVKTPNRAEKLTGLKLISAYPKIVNKKKGINYDYIQERLLQIAIQKLIKLVSDLDIKPSQSPIKVLVYSTLQTDGKSLITDELVGLLRALNKKVLYLNYKLPFKGSKYIHEVSINEDNLVYSIDRAFFNVEDFSQLPIEEDLNFKLDDYDFLFYEIPSIVSNPYPPELIKQTDISIMLVRANRTWQKSDINAVESIHEFLPNKSFVFLNGANPEFLQDLIGELPRKRSRIRRIIKKMIRLQFFERYQIKK